MQDDQLRNLSFHLFQIANSFTSALSETGTVLALDSNDRPVPEPVCNHHLIDLLCQLSPAVFMHYCESIFGWLSDPENGYVEHPFTLDSYTHFCRRTEENVKLLENNIAMHQLEDGAIPVFTAHLRGGDFFSTLWAGKILVQYDPAAFADQIKKALSYLIAKEPVSARSVSQKGFLLYLLLLFKPATYKEEIENLWRGIRTAAEAISFEKGLLESIDDIFLLEDLIEYYRWSKSEVALSIVEKKLISLFELDHELKLPKFFEKWNSARPQQAYYQALLKSAVVAAKYLHAVDAPVPALELNSHIHGVYRKARQFSVYAERELKRYKDQYDPIESEFSRYESPLQTMWRKTSSEYERSIFLMMPFKNEMVYRKLTEEIRNVCADQGYKAFRVDDEFRHPFDTLWENLVFNMLGCKYGISVYVTEKAVDKMTDELRFFQNPNVALEYGFMKAHGKRVLVLKDESSKTPSDLQGFVWRSFDLRNPDKTVATALMPWLRELESDVKEVPNTGGDAAEPESPQ